MLKRTDVFKKPEEAIKDYHETFDARLASLVLTYTTPTGVEIPKAPLWRYYSSLKEHQVAISWPDFIEVVLGKCRAEPHGWRALYLPTPGKLILF